MKIVKPLFKDRYKWNNAPLFPIDTELDEILVARRLLTRKCKMYKPCYCEYKRMED